MSKVVVLASGGPDSTLLALRASREGRLAGLVFVDYGHPARLQEAWRAFGLAKHLGVPLKAIHVFGLDLAEMEDGSAESPRVVPGRNLILLALAANVAKGWEASAIEIGCIAEDAREYGDCRESSLADAGAALVGMSGVAVRYPLVNTPKSAVMAELRELSPDPMWWSCYEGGFEPCGKCASCRLVQDSGGAGGTRGTHSGTPEQNRYG